MYNTIFKLIAVLVLFAICLPGCGRNTDALAPDQVDVSMVDQVIKVKGEITFVVENPMGVGGVYLKLGNSKGEVDVRIQPELWDSYQAYEKAVYEKGKTVTVEGILSRAGENLVVVHGKYDYSNTSVTSNSTLH